MATVSLTVNGKAVSADAEADTLLAEFIRENLALLASGMDFAAVVFYAPAKPEEPRI